MKKSAFKKHLAVYLLNFLILTLMLSLGWFSLFSSASDPLPYLKKAEDSCTYLETSASVSPFDDEMLAAFPEEAHKIIVNGKKEMLVLSSEVPSDGCVYAAEETVKKTQGSLDFKIKSRKYSMKAKTSNNLPEGFFFINPSYQSYGIQEDLPLYVEGGFWETKEHQAEYYNNGAFKVETKGPSFITPSYAAKMYGYDNTLALEDRVFYISSPALEADGKAEFAEKGNRDQNSSFTLDLNKAFPEGVRISYLGDKRLNEENNEWRESVIVSQKTMADLLSFCPDYNGLIFFLDGKANNVLSFLSSHNIMIATCDNERQNDLAIYNSIALNRISPANLSWCLILVFSIPLFVFIIEAVSSLSLASTDQKNLKILFAAGLNKRQLFILDCLPLLCFLSLSLISSFFLGIIEIDPLKKLGFSLLFHGLKRFGAYVFSCCHSLLF